MFQFLVCTRKETALKALHSVLRPAAASYPVPAAPHPSASKEAFSSKVLFLTRTTWSGVCWCQETCFRGTNCSQRYGPHVCYLPFCLKSTVNARAFTFFPVFLCLLLEGPDRSSAFCRNVVFKQDLCMNLRFWSLLDKQGRVHDMDNSQWQRLSCVCKIASKNMCLVLQKSAKRSHRQEQQIDRSRCVGFPSETPSTKQYILKAKADSLIARIPCRYIQGKRKGQCTWSTKVAFVFLDPALGLTCALHWLSASSLSFIACSWPCKEIQNHAW